MYLRFLSSLGVMLSFTLFSVFPFSELSAQKVSLSSVSCSKSLVYPDFPYIADFGTLSVAGADNIYWQDTTLDGCSSSAWNFEVLPGSDSHLAPCYTGGDIETNPTLFSRPFSLKKAVGYKIKITYYTASTFNEYPLMLRLNRQQNHGSFYYTVSDQKFMPSSTSIESLLLDKTTAPIGAGISVKEFTIPAQELSVDGIYALSFSIVNTSAAKGKALPIKLYIASLEIQEVLNLDLGVGQIQTPYANCSSIEQKVSFFVQNKGNQNISSFSAYYRWGLDPVVKETFSVEVLPGKISKVSFSVPVLMQLNQNTHHSLQVWLDPLPGDLNHNNDSSALYNYNLNYESYSVPHDFSFSNLSDSYGFICQSDSTHNRAAWQYEALSKEFRLNTAKKANQDWLVSPCVNLQKGKTYRISFTYRAQGADAYENLDLAVVSKPLAPYSKEERQAIWSTQNFSATTNQHAFAYYTALADGTYYLSFRAFSEDGQKGLVLNQLSIDTAVFNEMDFFYEYDVYSDKESPLLQANKFMDFMDLNNDGTTWTVNEKANAGLAYNSSYAAKAVAKKGVTANDYLLFHPVKLQAGVSYTVGIAGKGGSSNVLNYDLCVYPYAPPYTGVAQESKGEFKWTETAGTLVYADVEHSFRVVQDGVYYVSVHYKVNTPNDFNTNSANYDLYVDNFRLYARKKTSAQFLGTSVPMQAKMGSNRVYLTALMKNYKGSSLVPNELTYCYQINDNVPIRENSVGDVPPYACDNFTFATYADFSAAIPYTLKFWIESAGSNDPIDTVGYSFDGLPSFAMPYLEDFSLASSFLWTTRTAHSGEPVWSIKENESLAYEGKWLAACEPKGMDVQDYLISPPLALALDTTYLFSFYYRHPNASFSSNEKEKLEVYYSYNGNDIYNFTDTLLLVKDLVKTEYTKYSTYINMSALGERATTPLFLAFKASLPAFSQPIYLDRVLIMDSISSVKTQIKLSDLHYRKSVSECEFRNAEEISVRLTNIGFFNLDSVKLQLSLDGKAPQEVSYTKILGFGETVDYILPVTWDLSVGGKHTVKIYAAMADEKNRVDDTLYGEAEVIASETLPLLLDFEGGMDGLKGSIVDANQDGNTWKLGTQPSLAHSGSNYLFYQGQGRSTEDHFLTTCFTARAQEYGLVFYAKNKSNNVSDYFQIYLRHYSENQTFTDKLLRDSIFPLGSYDKYECLFKTQTEGRYAIVFVLKSKQSASDAVSYLEDISLSVYGIRDVALNAFVEPVPIKDTISEGLVPLNLKVKISLTNKGNWRESKIPFTALLNNVVVSDAEEMMEEIKGGATSFYTFSKKISLSSNRDSLYDLKVFSFWKLDENRKNDTIAMRLSITIRRDTIPKDSLGVEKNNFRLNYLSAYPNPVMETLNINYTEGVYEVQIFDIQGRLWRVLAVGKRSTSLSLDIRGYKSGLYIIKALSDKGVSTVKISKL